MTNIFRVSSWMYRKRKGGYTRIFFARNGRVAGLSKVMLAALLAIAFLTTGCGGAGEDSFRQSLIDYTINSLLYGGTPGQSMLIRLMPTPQDSGEYVEADPEKYWSKEAGKLQEITGDEYQKLRDEIVTEDGSGWRYSDNAITILYLDKDKGGAEVEVGSLWGPINGRGVRYTLRLENNEWRKITETTTWNM